MSQSIHRIVAIEDNPADYALLREALTAHGEPFSLEVLPDGESAIRYVREQGRDSAQPCLFVLDLHLPPYNGAIILREIRGNPDLAHVSVAVLTTIASPQEQAEVMALGVSLYRNKPMTWDDTVTLAGELIELCKRAM
jgi:CheY-like chemotaxis protein